MMAFTFHRFYSTRTTCIVQTCVHNSNLHAPPSNQNVSGTRMPIMSDRTTTAHAPAMNCRRYRRLYLGVRQQRIHVHFHVRHNAAELSAINYKLWNISSLSVASVTKDNNNRNVPAKQKTA